jgi:hypothetical protein
MKPFPNLFLNFQEAYAIGDQLWDLGEFLQNDPKYVKPANWILTYRYAIRAMLARIVTVDREYRNLNEPGRGMAPTHEPATSKAKNEWNVIWESYAGVLFFAMDSSLECCTYALNALGYLLSPDEFIDITTDEKLKRITPANLLDPPTKGNASHSAYGACLKTFPELCAHWSANRDLRTQIIEYHDATKHRHSAVVGQDEWCHYLKLAPKQAMGKIVFDQPTGFVGYDGENSLTIIGDGSISKYDAAIAKARNDGTATVYAATDSKLVTGWGGIRNDAAHDPGAFSRSREDVRRMIDGIREFISRTS